MEPYHIKYQHQETENHSEHSSANCYGTGCTRDTNTQHLHDETKVLRIDTHLKLHATQLKQLTQISIHSLHDFNAYSDPPRNKTATIFHNNSEPTNHTLAKLPTYSKP